MALGEACDEEDTEGKESGKDTLESTSKEPKVNWQNTHLIKNSKKKIQLQEPESKEDTANANLHVIGEPNKQSKHLKNVLRLILSPSR